VGGASSTHSRENKWVQGLGGQPEVKRPLGRGRRRGEIINLLNPTGHVMHHQFNIQQLYALPTLYLCVLSLSENKQRLVPLTA
jgi:hypothetical protein